MKIVKRKGVQPSATRILPRLPPSGPLRIQVVNSSRHSVNLQSSCSHVEYWRYSGKEGKKLKAHLSSKVRMGVRRTILFVNNNCLFVSPLGVRHLVLRYGSRMYSFYLFLNYKICVRGLVTLFSFLLLLLQNIFNLSIGVQFLRYTLLICGSTNVCSCRTGRSECLY